MAPEGRFEALLSRPGPALLDGAMGTMLFAAGLTSGDSPEAWNTLHPERIRAVHRAYLAAGAQVILTNTFGGTRLRLAMHALDDQVAELNRAGAALARAEADAVGGAVVAGSVGPSGQILTPFGDLEPAEAEAAFAEQAQALVEGGVDVLWIETMSALEEVDVALAGVRRVAPGWPVVVTMSFDTRGHTMMGVSPAAAVAALLARGVAAVGANCGTGPEELVAAVAAMHGAVPGAVLVAKGNAGIPQFVDGAVAYGGSPATMAPYARAARDAGARLIGACCGSTPAHVAAMREALA